MLAAAARRVEGRFEANKGGNGPSPTPAAPPCEGAPVWAAFPELSAAGRRVALAPRWPSAHVWRTENRICAQLLCRKRVTWLWLGAPIPTFHRRQLLCR